MPPGEAIGIEVGGMALNVDTMRQQAEEKTSSMQSCPSCGGHDVRRSRARGLLDDVMANFRRFPFRCRACSRRFYRYVAADGEEVEPERDAEGAPAESRHGTDSQR